MIGHQTVQMPVNAGAERSFPCWKYLMTDERGVTLIELLLVASVIAILAVGLVFTYQGWVGNYKVEDESKKLYTDFMDARARAMTRNRMHFVVVNANDYRIYEDTNENGVVEPGAGDNPIPEFTDPATGLVRPKVLEYPLDATGWLGTVSFDTGGFATFVPAPASLPAGIIITARTDLNPDFNCVALDRTRIRTGKVSGGICVAK